MAYIIPFTSIVARGCCVGPRFTPTRLFTISIVKIGKFVPITVDTLNELMSKLIPVPVEKKYVLNVLYIVLPMPDNELTFRVDKVRELPKPLPKFNVLMYPVLKYRLLP